MARYYPSLLIRVVAVMAVSRRGHRSCNHLVKARKESKKNGSRHIQASPSSSHVAGITLHIYAHIYGKYKERSFVEETPANPADIYIRE